jgi:hypothetical protein
MSRTTILAAALGCVVLFAIWVQSGEEPSPIAHEQPRAARRLSDSKSTLPEPRRPRSLLDRSAPRGQEHAEPEKGGVQRGGEVVVRDRIEPRPGYGGGGAMPEEPDELSGPARLPRRERGRHAGVIRRGESRRQGAEPDEMAKVEQPPLRQPRSFEDEFDDESVELLRDVALGDPDPDERVDAISKLDLDDPEAMDVLIKALDDADSEVRLAALDELWTNTEDPPVNILERVINDPDPEIRLEAVRILSESDEPFAHHLLRGALTDLDEDVREEAADALELVSD